MADTDYDAPRVREGATPEPPLLEELMGPRARTRAGDSDEVVGAVGDAANFLDRLSNEDPGLPGPVQQADEFTCSRCFLIVHRRQFARTQRGNPVCRDCG